MTPATIRRHGGQWHQWVKAPKVGSHVLDAYILIQTHVSKAATVTAMVATVPGISEVASLAGPYDVIARAQSQDMDHLAELVTSRIQPLDGVARTMSCAVVRL